MKLNSWRVKGYIWFTLCILLFGLGVPQSKAAFTSLYIFGDGVSTTTTNHTPTYAPYYYGGRWSNGRVWVEVLAQRQGLSADSKFTNVTWSNSSNNWSY